MDNIKVSPSILSADFVNMEQSIKNLEAWGADYVHCDVMDGVYVPNITFGMPMIKAIRNITNLILDVHLMITEPEKYIPEFIKAGADIITFHPDASKDAQSALRTIRTAGKKCGIVLNPNIGFDQYKELLFDCDILLIMSVYAGFGGQKFIEETLNKAKEAIKFINDNNLNVEIEIDGGINEENAKLVKEHGVTILVAGSAVFNSKNPKETIKNLKF